MNVRAAQLADVDRVAILFDQYRVWYHKESDLEGAKQFLAERIKNEESVIYIVEHEGVLCGFTQLYPLFSSTRMKRLWLLNDLFVAVEHRGKGYSKALIDAAKELARSTGAAGVSLETDKVNVVANQLYPATDFELNIEQNFYFWTTV